MAFGTPPAYMGFVGYAKFDFPANDVIVRATTADVALSQDITRNDVMDGRFDRTVYQVGPYVVEGSVEFPAIMERGGRTDPTARLWRAAAARDTTGDRQGRLKADNAFNLDIRYTTQFAEFSYKDCIVDEFNFSVEQSDLVNINTSIIGRTREKKSIGGITRSTPGYPQNSRVVTWNDAIVEILDRGGGGPNVTGEYIRTFDMTLANNASRFYTLNGQLFPQDIAVQKRDISGSMTLMGRHEGLGDHARTNAQRCHEESAIKFGYRLNRGDCNSTFVVTMPNIVFQIEELELTNDLFETTINWHALPDEIDLTSSSILETAGSVV